MPQTNKSLVPTFPLSIVPFELKLSSLLKFFGAFIILIIFSLLIVSVYQLNAYTTEVYFIHNSEKGIAELTQENKILEINLAKANSLSNVEEYVQNFEKASKIEYIRVLENAALGKINYANPEN